MIKKYRNMTQEKWKRQMLHFSDWKKKKEKKTDYEIVKSRSGLPMFVLDPSDSLSNLTPNDDEHLKKKNFVPEIVRRVCNFISDHSH